MSQNETLLEDFVYTLMNLVDKINEENAKAEVINPWYDRTQQAFGAIVDEAIEAKLETLRVRHYVDYDGGGHAYITLGRLVNPEVEID